MRTIVWESRFKKDFKNITKQGKNVEKLKEIINALQVDKLLPPKNKNHKLKGEYTWILGMPC